MSTVKSLSVGDGDMFYIRHGSDSFTIIDTRMDEEDRANIVRELEEMCSGKTVLRFISTHPDDDHLRGLQYLDKQIGLPNFYCVANDATKDDVTDDFAYYCRLRDSDRAYYLRRGCRRKWLNQSDEERGGAGLNILWPDTSNPHYQQALTAVAEGETPNNISIILKYSLQDGANILWMGDLETDFMEAIEPALRLDPVDVLFAPHHGRASGRPPASILNELSPRIIVLGEAPAEELAYFPGYNTLTQNSAGDITFECEQGLIHIYTSQPGYEVDFLVNHGRGSQAGQYYLGTLEL